MRGIWRLKTAYLRFGQRAWFLRKRFVDSYWTARQGLLAPRRIVRLSPDRLSPESIQSLEDDELYNGILADLAAYTGFSAEELAPYLLRHPRKNYKSEFAWYAPQNERELTWYYRCSSGYLFANAAHPYDARLRILKDGRVLDYGAGAGCNTMGLAKTNREVDFVEINRIQADFVAFRADRKGLQNVREISPYTEGRFDPVGCIKGPYDAIVAIDVLEHVPNYERVVRHFIDCLKPGGLIVEHTPFSQRAGKIALHLRASRPMDDAMTGMVKLEEGIWKKVD